MVSDIFVDQSGLSVTKHLVKDNQSALSHVALIEAGSKEEAIPQMIATVYDGSWRYNGAVWVPDMTDEILERRRLTAEWRQSCPYPSNISLQPEDFGGSVAQPLYDELASKAEGYYSNREEVSQSLVSVLPVLKEVEETVDIASSYEFLDDAFGEVALLETHLEFGNESGNGITDAPERVLPHKDGAPDDYTSFLLVESYCGPVTHVLENGSILHGWGKRLQDYPAERLPLTLYKPPENALLLLMFGGDEKKDKYPGEAPLIGRGIEHCTPPHPDGVNSAQRLFSASLFSLEY